MPSFSSFNDTCPHLETTTCTRSSPRTLLPFGWCIKKKKKKKTPNQEKKSKGLADTDEDSSSGATIDSDDGYVAVPAHSDSNPGHGAAAAGKDDDALSVDDNGDCDESRLLSARDAGPENAAGGGSGSGWGRISTKMIPADGDGGGGERGQATVMEM